MSFNRNRTTTTLDLDRNTKIEVSGIPKSGAATILEITMDAHDGADAVITTITLSYEQLRTLESIIGLYT